MRFRKLGSSNLKVSEVCLGTMTWGSWNNKQEAHAQLDRFVEIVEKANGGDWSKGKAFIDTAELYPVPPKAEYCGCTEEFIGEWISTRQGVRDKIVLASKVAGPWGGRGFIADKREEALGGDVKDAPKEGTIHNPEQIERAVAASLKRLQTDCIDLYQLHWPSRPAPTFGAHQFSKKMAEGARNGVIRGEKLDAVVNTIGKLIKEGKIKAWGLSNETAFGTYMFCEAAERLKVPLPATIQQDFSLLDRVYEEGVLEVCSYFDVALLSYGPLAGGTLSGKYLDKVKEYPQVIAGSEKSRHSSEPNFQPRYYAPRSAEAARKYAELAIANNMAPATLALAWCYQLWYMGAVIIGATSVEQMEQDCEACEVQLSQEILEKIEQIHLECPNPNRTD